MIRPKMVRSFFDRERFLNLDFFNTVIAAPATEESTTKMSVRTQSRLMRKSRGTVIKRALFKNPGILPNWSMAHLPMKLPIIAARAKARKNKSTHPSLMFLKVPKAKRIQKKAVTTKSPREAPRSVSFPG
ncbi:MAG: hypothetical protein P8Z38_04515 [Robiginitalea sp.]